MYTHGINPPHIAKTRVLYRSLQHWHHSSCPWHHIRGSAAARRRRYHVQTVKQPPALPVSHLGSAMWRTTVSLRTQKGCIKQPHACHCRSGSVAVWATILAIDQSNSCFTPTEAGSRMYDARMLALQICN